MSEKDGGPAFPHLKPMFRYDGNGIATEVAPELNGMSLRDWFAGQALAAWKAVTLHLKCLWCFDVVFAPGSERPANRAGTCTHRPSIPLFSPCADTGSTAAPVDTNSCST